MKATVETVSPLGYRVQFVIEAGEGLEGLLHRLADLEPALRAAGYEPARELPGTPDGLPICPKHRVPMPRREKQGDEWFSHKVVVNGQEIYCKGRSGLDSPGWEY